MKVEARERVKVEARERVKVEAREHVTYVMPVGGRVALEGALRYEGRMARADHMHFRDRWTLVTGASSGLGLEIARVLARDYGSNIIAVARRADRLEALKNELESAHGVRVQVCPADLTQPGAVDQIFDEATRDRQLYAAVLNAGVTYFGHILDQPEHGLDAMLATNVVSIAKLGTRVARYLRDLHTGGGLLFVSSLTGLTPMPYQATYGATKAFIINFGMGLAYELRGSGVSVTVFAPGGMATEMLTQTPGISTQFKPGQAGVMDADRSAKLVLDAFARRTAFFVPGALYRVAALALKLAPQALVMSQIERIYRAAFLAAKATATSERV